MGAPHWFRVFKHKRRVARALAEVNSRRALGIQHNLDGKLVVSLTSYPARFETLAKTLRSLLLQSMQADKTILWIAHDAIDKLPADVLACQAQGLTIQATHELRSYTKLIPTLSAYPDAYIVTADDDIYYGADWLKDLVEAHHKSGAKVICHRAHEMALNDEKRPAPYSSWSHNTDKPAQSELIFPTGVSGVFYAPNCFDPRVLDQGLFQSLCPYADDVWFYWMHRLTGGCAQKIGGRRRILEWNMTPASDLRAYNVLENGNDVQINELIKTFGFPK